MEVTNKFTIYNYSGVDIQRFVISTRPEMMPVLETRTIPAGQYDEFELKMRPTIDQVYYQLVSGNTSMFGCMSVAADTPILIGNSEQTYMITTCVRDASNAAPSTPVRFIKDSNYWSMTAAEYPQFMSMKTPSTYLVAFKTIDVQALTPMDELPELPRLNFTKEEKKDEGTITLSSDAVEDDSTSYTWLWIILLIFVILAVVFVVFGIYYWKKSKN